MIVQSDRLWDDAAEGAPASLVVLLAGRTGQGVPLAADLLRDAAESAGYQASVCESFMASEGDDLLGSSRGVSRGAVCCRVTLTAPGAYRVDARADWLAALDLWVGDALVEELRRTGRALFLDSTPVEGSTFDGNNVDCGESRICSVAPALVELGDDASQPAVYVLGALSRALPFTHADWLAALSQNLPARLQTSAHLSFELGARAAWTSARAMAV